MLEISAPRLVVDLFWDRFRSDQRRKQLQRKRLEMLIQYVRKHSPYYAEALKNLPDDFELADLPIMTKPQMMENFDDVLTDRAVNMERCMEFMEDFENRKRKLDDRYTLVTTSGSTGVPLVALYDKLALGLFVYMGATRLIPSYRQFLKMLMKGFTIANLISDQGFFIGNGSLHQNIAKVKKPDKLMRIYDILDPMDKIVAGLNEFDPLAMHCYPSILELLLEEKKAGRLKINPMMILCGGEKLREEVRLEAQEVFGVKVYGNYSCTEAGSIGYECSHQRLHLNEDWLILEAVDEEFQPVKTGEKSARILVTNLGNYIMPFIRYEVSDQVVFLPEPCACGKKSQCIVVEGRVGDNVDMFKADGTLFKVSYIQLLTGVKSVEGVQRFQVVAHFGKDNLFEIRLLIKEGNDKELVFQRVADCIANNLKQIKAPEATYILSEDEPRANPKTGKFSPVYQLKEDYDQ